MTRGWIVVLGIVGVILIAGAAVVDFTLTDSQIDDLAPAQRRSSTAYDAAAKRTELREDWERRRVWYAFGAAAVALLTLAAAVVASPRPETAQPGSDAGA